MRVHHLNCGTMCPHGAGLLPRAGGLLDSPRLVAHCLVIEVGGELVLLDTGFGTRDVADPARLGRPVVAVIGPRFDPAETAVRQVESLGFDSADVRHVLITHLDLDHAGGLGDFPVAQVHVFERELAAATAPSRRERSRYVPAQWEHRPNWVAHGVGGDSWLGFESVRLLPGLDVEIAMIPLTGHTRGHAAFAISDSEGWLLHCGDAFFHRGEVETPPSCPRGLALYQKLTCVNDRVRLENRERLRELAREHAEEVRLICSHDPQMLAAAAERAVV